MSDEDFGSNLIHNNRLENLIIATAESIRPPERLTVSQAAEKYRYLNNTGHYIGYWDNSIAPYLVEPMDEMGSDEFTGLIFAGPARTGKSDMFFNWLGHTAICDPADMLLVHMTQSTARDWSQGDLRKVFRASPAINERVVAGRQNMNTHDIKFISGMRLLVKWPVIAELSGKTVPRVWFMDYDRMPLDVDKEGAPYDLGRKRTTTFGRHGMTVAESSPGHAIENPRWSPATPHEAPPTQGILALYNRGDRRRYYWRCNGCNDAFEGDFKHLSWPESADALESAEQAVLVCPHCGFCHTHEPSRDGGDGKHALNLNGRWIKDGMVWMPDGSISGSATRSDIASFWLKGTHAAFADWKSLVLKYINAMREYENTQSDLALQVTVNTDQGHPFLPPSMAAERLPEDLKNRARDYGRHVVPEGVRYLVATIDVQKNSFEVQVQGFGEGGDIWIIDRFNIRTSKRVDTSSPEENQFLWVNPASHLEDWQLIVGQVIEKTYALDDESGRHMAIKVIGCDSGGRDGVTSKAYEFWRWLRDEHDGGHHKRFQLVKGMSEKDAPRVRITYPDSDRKDRRAGARGEVPVLAINPNLVKDMVYAMLGRTDPKGGEINFPEWLPSSFYAELTAETRSSKGWADPRKRRNEAWDLLYYAVALSLSNHIRSETIDWSNPPKWAEVWDENDMIFVPDQEDRPFENKSVKYALADLGSSLM